MIESFQDFGGHLVGLLVHDLVKDGRLLLLDREKMTDKNSVSDPDPGVFWIRIQGLMNMVARHWIKTQPDFSTNVSVLIRPSSSAQSKQ